MGVHACKAMQALCRPLPCLPARQVLHSRTAQPVTAAPPASCRPRRLLVFVNPFGGARRGKKIWDTVVRPVFDKAGIKCTAVETQHGGHARALLTSECLGGSGEAIFEDSRCAVVCWPEQQDIVFNAMQSPLLGGIPGFYLAHLPAGMPSDELAGYDGVVAIGGDGCACLAVCLVRLLACSMCVIIHAGTACCRTLFDPTKCLHRMLAGWSCGVETPCKQPVLSMHFLPCSLFHEIINGLMELRSVATGTTLDQQQWAELQLHLEETAAADAAAAAIAGGPVAQAGQAGGAQPPAGSQQQASGPLVRGSSFGLPSGPQHQRRRGGHQRLGSIAASMRVGHIPAGSTDAGEYAVPDSAVLHAVVFMQGAPAPAEMS